MGVVKLNDEDRSLFLALLDTYYRQATRYGYLGATGDAAKSNFMAGQSIGYYGACVGLANLLGVDVDPDFAKLVWAPESRIQEQREL